jgi:PAS domain S-box-containing protein
MSARGARAARRSFADVTEPVALGLRGADRPSSAPPDGVLTIDAAGVIATCSASAERLFGRARADVLGRNLAILLGPARPHDTAWRHLSQWLAAADADAPSARIEVDALRGDGSAFPAELVAIRVPDGGPRITLVVRDLAAERSTEETLRRAAIDGAEARLAAEHNADEARQLAALLQDQATELEQQTEEAQALAEELEQTNEQLRDTLVEVAEARDLAESRLDQLQASEARYRRLFMDGPVPMWLYSPETLAFLDVNECAVAHYGYTRAELLTMSIKDIRPPEDVPALLRVVDRVRRDERLVSRGTYRHRRKDGSIIHVEVTTQDITSEGERARLAIVVDVSERRRAEETSQFLAAVADTLSGSLDYDETLQRVADVVVPRLADGCIIDLVEGGAGARGGATLARVALAHSDPGMRAQMDALRAFPPVLSDASHPVIRVLGTRQPELVDDVQTHRDTSHRPEPHRAVIRTLGPRGALFVPLVARDRALGALTLFVTEPGRVLAEHDIPLAVEVAARAALAIDNAQLLRASEAARSEAEVASRAKTDFLAVISHELRTPLNAILGYSDLLLDGIFGPIAGAQRLPVERLRASGRHLLALIDEILSLPRIEAGLEDVRTERVDVLALAREAAAFVAATAAGKGLELVVDVPDGHPCRIDTDATKVRQILLNLLSNAVKFTAAGTVTIGARVESAAVLFVVRDTGPGISASDLPRVFEPFWQARDHTKSAYATRASGLGLGLSVSRRLARLLGGDVTVASTPHVGSAFALRLPRPADEL